MKNTSIEISKNEAWKMIDAIVHYQKDYSVNKSVEKIFESLLVKLKKIAKP